MSVPETPTYPLNLYVLLSLSDLKVLLVRGLNVANLHVLQFGPSITVASRLVSNITGIAIGLKSVPA